MKDRTPNVFAIIVHVNAKNGVRFMIFEFYVFSAIFRFLQSLMSINVVIMIQMRARTIANIHSALLRSDLKVMFWAKNKCQRTTRACFQTWQSYL